MISSHSTSTHRQRSALVATTAASNPSTPVQPVDAYDGDRSRVMAQAAGDDADRWRDWQSVGQNFRRFHQLSESSQTTILRGDTLCGPIIISDRLLWGSVYRYVPNVEPKALCDIFADYDGQSRFVPGMTVTKTIKRNKSLSLVDHCINPITFIDDAAQTTWPKWLYGLLTYSYKLDEEVRTIQTEHGTGYAIRWSIPQEKWKPQARENGEIMFTPLNAGTLITYNNATEPYGYDLVKSILPTSTFDSTYRSLGDLAKDYYRRTVDNLVKLNATLSKPDRQ